MATEIVRKPVNGAAANFKAVTERLAEGAGVTLQTADEEKTGDGTAQGQSKKYNADFQEAVSTKHVAEMLNVDESMVIDDLNMSDLEKEQNPYTKTDLSQSKSKKAKIKLDDGETMEILGCKVTRKDVTSGFLFAEKTTMTYHVESEYLGSFDYDPDEFTFKYKELPDGSQLPFLEYTGSGDGGANITIGGAEIANFGSDIKIPDGIKNIDYMFARNDDLKYVPKIPSSVESMHYTFAGCENLEFSVTPNIANAPASLIWDDYDVSMPWASKHIEGYAVFLPDGLKDMSGAFKDCSKLDADFSCQGDKLKVFGIDVQSAGVPKLPSGVVNIQKAFEGCEALQDSNFRNWASKVSEYPQYGDTITPYLTSTYAQDALNKISDENAKKQADTTEYLIGEDGQPTSEEAKQKIQDGIEDGSIDKDTLTHSRIHTRLNRLERVHKGEVESDNQLASGGARSNNYYYNAHEESIQDDITGLIVSDKKPGTLSSLWQRIAIDGGVGLGIGAVMSKVTGNSTIGTVAGLASAVALDWTDVLPESLVPVLNWTKKKLPDGKIKDAVDGFLNTIAPSTIDDQLEDCTPENVAATYQNRRLQRSLFGVTASYELADINKSMYNNAEYCGKNMNFKATADVALKEGEAHATAGAKAVVHAAVSSMEEHWNNGNGTPEGMKEYYVGLMDALEQYNKGARRGIEQLANADYQATSSQGLQMLNRAYTDEVITSLKTMDAKYHFMDDAAWSHIAGLNISGVDIQNIKEYNGTQFSSLSAASIADVNATIQASENYVIGEEVVHREGEAFYNSGKGLYYNEYGNPHIDAEPVGTTTDEEKSEERYGQAADELGDAAAAGAKAAKYNIHPHTSDRVAEIM